MKTSPGPRFSDFAPFRVALCREGGTLVAMVRECWHQLRLAGCVEERDHMINQRRDYRGPAITAEPKNGNTHAEVSL